MTIVRSVGISAVLSFVVVLQDVSLLVSGQAWGLAAPNNTPWQESRTTNNDHLGHGKDDDNNDGTTKRQQPTMDSVSYYHPLLRRSPVPQEQEASITRTKFPRFELRTDNDMFLEYVIPLPKERVTPSIELRILATGGLEKTATATTTTTTSKDSYHRYVLELNSNPIPFNEDGSWSSSSFSTNEHPLLLSTSVGSSSSSTTTTTSWKIQLPLPSSVEIDHITAIWRKYNIDNDDEEDMILVVTVPKTKPVGHFVAASSPSKNQEDEWTKVTKTTRPVSRTIPIVVEEGNEDIADLGKPLVTAQVVNNNNKNKDEVFRRTAGGRISTGTIPSSSTRTRTKTTRKRATTTTTGRAIAARTKASRNDNSSTSFIKDVRKNDTKDDETNKEDALHPLKSKRAFR